MNILQLTPLMFILLAPSRYYFTLLICTGTTALLVFGLIFVFPRPPSSGTLRFLPWPNPFNNAGPASATLGIASKIYVLSLPRRTDRREQMETLRVALGLRWSYLDAIESNNEIVDKILERVRLLRGKDVYSLDERNPSKPAVLTSKNTFLWPDDIITLSASGEPMTTSGSDLWSFSLGNSSADNFSYLEPLTCATENYNISSYTLDLPQYMILSPARIACWHSHLAVIRRIATDKGVTDDVSVVFEDDIDMEWDIHERLGNVWPLLPSDWDIVFLGHCWSNESHYPALERTHDRCSSNLTVPPISLEPANALLPRTGLHPSSSPKCTHAYALSRTGARRLLLHLIYPPFAYSRALDQAFAWLVMSGRLKSYSVVPSVVVQRKVGKSDVMAGNGSTWKDELVKGVFGN